MKNLTWKLTAMIILVLGGCLFAQPANKNEQQIDNDWFYKNYTEMLIAIQDPAADADREVGILVALWDKYQSDKLLAYNYARYLMIAFNAHPERVLAAFSDKPAAYSGWLSEIPLLVRQDDCDNHAELQKYQGLATATVEKYLTGKQGPYEKMARDLGVALQKMSFPEPQ